MNGPPGAARRWRFVVWPDHPEPIDVATYRRGERLVVWIVPVLVALNVLTRLAADLTTANVAAFDVFLCLNLPAHASAFGLSLYALRGERSLAFHRGVAYFLVVALLGTSLPGLWLLGSVTPNINIGFYILTIAIMRIVYDARLGLWALLWALGTHGALVALEVGGVVRSQAMLPERVRLEVYERPIIMTANFVWIAATYVLVWALSSYVAYRFRASEHATRLLNLGLEERVRVQVDRLARAQRLRRYLAPQLAEQILRSDVDPGDVRGRRPITVLFADLRGFTPMVERLPPDVLAAVLNRWFDEVARIAFSHGGTIDKFIGDAAMIFFGAPEALGEREQATRCVRMALEIQRRVRELGDEFVALGTGRRSRCESASRPVPRRSDRSARRIARTTPSSVPW